jgi:hypothetical protein
MLIKERKNCGDTLKHEKEMEDKMIINRKISYT